MKGEWMEKNTQESKMNEKFVTSLGGSRGNCQWMIANCMKKKSKRSMISFLSLLWCQFQW